MPINIYKLLARNPGGTPGTSIDLPNPLRATSIQALLGGIIKYLSLYIAPPIVTLMIFWGAFQILTAAGNPEKIITGRKTITYAVVGYAIIWIGWGFVSVINNFIGAQ